MLSDPLSYELDQIGGGLVVSMYTFYSDDPSLNLADSKINFLLHEKV